MYYIILADIIQHMFKSDQYVKLLNIFEYKFKKTN